MTMEQVLATLRGLEGVLELAPAEGSEFPPVAWGDHFFYYAPDGRVPEREQPYATIVTKDYPDDTGSHLDPPGRWRLNIHVGRDRLAALIGGNPRSTATPEDLSTADVLLPHPLYGRQGWVAIVNPGERTTATAVALLREAHENARSRASRRAAGQRAAGQRAADPCLD